MPLPTPLRPIPLWAGPWTEEALKKRYDDNPRSFDRGYRLRAWSDKESSFPSFEQCRTPGLVLGDIVRRTQWPAFTGVDLSGKKRPGNAIVTVRVDPVSRHRYPVDVRYLARAGPEVCESLNIVNEIFRPTVIMVEDNGYQESLLDWVGSEKAKYPFWVKIEATTTTGGKKSDADKGLPSLEVEFKNKAWVVPYSEYEAAGLDSPTPACHWVRWDNEFRFHPLAATTDGVMATWFARQGIEIYGGFGAGSTALTEQSIGGINSR